MSTNTNFDRIAEAWLAEGPAQLADRVLDAALDEVHLTRQRRRLPVPWRFNPMPNSVRVAAAALVGVLVVGVIYLNLPGLTGPGGSPTPSPTATVAPSDAPVATPAVFFSERYGYTVGLPAGIHSLPSSEVWRAGVMPCPECEFLDRFSGQLDGLSPPTDASSFAGIASQPLPDGMSGDEWMAEYILFIDACSERPEDWVATSVAGAAGRQVRADCGSGPGTVTEIVFATEDTGWLITGDTPLVEVLRAAFEIPR